MSSRHAPPHVRRLASRFPAEAYRPYAVDPSEPVRCDWPVARDFYRPNTTEPCGRIAKVTVKGREVCNVHAGMARRAA